jgi:hypothetical protein
MHDACINRQVAESKSSFVLKLLYKIYSIEGWLVYIRVTYNLSYPSSGGAWKRRL